MAGAPTHFNPSLIFLKSHLDQVADPMIEADFLLMALGKHSRKIPGWPLDRARTHVTFSFLHLGSCAGFGTDF